MDKSNSIKELAIALNKAQAEFTPAPFNSSNPHLRNKYADLGSIIESTKPVLAKHGLSVSQMVSGVANEIGVTTLLMHNSGEWLESSVIMPIVEQKGINNAQVAGSIISYLRRYALAAALGVYSDDNDAQAPRPQAVKEISTRDLPKDLPLTTATNGHATPARMSLEMASSELSSDGVPYGELSNAELGNRSIGISKGLKKNGLTPEQKTEYLRKQDAIATVLQSRQQAENDFADAQEIA